MREKERPEKDEIMYDEPALAHIRRGTYETEQQPHGAKEKQKNFFFLKIKLIARWSGAG